MFGRVVVALMTISMLALQQRLASGFRSIGSLGWARMSKFRQINQLSSRNLLSTRMRGNMLVDKRNPRLLSFASFAAMSSLASIEAASNPPLEYFRLDYRPVNYSVSDMFLSFDLSSNNTIVTTRSNITKRNDSPFVSPDLTLDGEELELIFIKIDGEPVPVDQYKVNDNKLSISGSYISSLPSFELETQVRLNPEKNLALSGLYKSGSLLCTQCEAMVSCFFHA